MFHAISKLLYVFSTPIFWIFILFFLAVIVKSRQGKKRFFLTGFIVFVIFSNSFIFDEIVGKWEPEMNKTNPTKKYEIAFVLGGYSSYAPKVKQINFGESTDRITAVLPLYFAKKVKKIVLSGGPGNLFDYSKPEAEYAAEYLESIGVKSTDIIVEPKSRNTYQNAVAARQIIDSLAINKKVLLITSTTHMIRAAACFKKQGILFDTYLVDGITGERKFYFDHLFVPNAQILSAWNTIIHEWIGLVTYKIAGYI